MNWKKNKINVAVQVLPEADGKVKYNLVDGAIEAIQKLGFAYRVCPFETVVECSYEEFPGLMETIHQACHDAGTERMITNLKIQVEFEQDVTIDDKMEKYD